MCACCKILGYFRVDNAMNFLHKCYIILTAMYSTLSKHMECIELNTLV